MQSYVPIKRFFIGELGTVFLEISGHVFSGESEHIKLNKTSQLQIYMEY